MEEFERSIHTEWTRRLINVVKVAEGYLQDLGVIHPLSDNPKIQFFDIEGTKYAPRELVSELFERRYPTSLLVRKSGDYMCNLFTYLGRAADSERPLPTKNRSSIWRSEDFDKDFDGNVESAILDYLKYHEAYEEDMISLVINEEWDSCTENSSENRRLNFIKEYKYKIRTRVKHLSDEDMETLYQNYMEGFEENLNEIRKLKSSLEKREFSQLTRVFESVGHSVDYFINKFAVI